MSHTVTLRNDLVSCSFQWSWLKHLNISYIAHYMHFYEKRAIDADTIELSVVDGVTEAMPYLLWFQHLFMNTLPAIPFPFLWSVYVLYGFMYSDEDHPHVKELIQHINLSWSDQSLQHMTPSQFETFRRYKAEHEPLGVPIRMYQTATPGDKHPWGHYFFQRGYWDELEQLDEEAQKEEIVLLFSSHDLGAQMCERTNGLWEILRFRLCEDLFWAGKSLIWADLCQGTTVPFIELFCREPPLAISLFDALLTRYSNACSFVNQATSIEVFVNNIPICLRVLFVDAYLTPGEIVNRFDRAHVRAYHDGNTIYATVQAMKSWRLRSPDITAPFPACEQRNTRNFTLPPVIWRHAPCLLPYKICLVAMDAIKSVADDIALVDPPFSEVILNPPLLLRIKNIRGKYSDGRLLLHDSRHRSLFTGLETLESSLKQRYCNGMQSTPWRYDPNIGPGTYSFSCDIAPKTRFYRKDDKARVVTLPLKECVMDVLVYIETAKWVRYVMHRTCVWEIIHLAYSENIDDGPPEHYFAVLERLN